MISAESNPPPPEEPSDTARLVREAQGGASGRFAELYERIAPAVYTWASLRIRPGMRAAVDPEDVVQEVWSRAWKAFEGFDVDNQSFRLWIFRIAKNVMLEALRKAQRGGSLAAGPTTRLFQLQNLPDSATAISRRVARHEGIATMLAWVEKLDDEDKKLFVHCGLEGLTYAQVSEATQIHKDTIAKRWQNLRARVAQFAVPKDMIAAEL